VSETGENSIFAYVVWRTQSKSMRRTPLELMTSHNDQECCIMACRLLNLEQQVKLCLIACKRNRQRGTEHPDDIMVH